MAKHTRSKIVLPTTTKTIPKSKQTRHKKIDSDDYDDNDDDADTLSSHSTLSMDPKQSLVNNAGRNLYISAMKQAHEVRCQAKIQQHNKKAPTLIERQTMLAKKKPIEIDDFNRLFEEKRFRPTTMKNDLMEIYQKSTSRVRSLLDKQEIDRFIRTTENRKNIK
ncbi:unnamed protein product [Rotaria magnacalcarata]|uniref:Uncharacterized protein n=1 Tax=Rotaria magnacalcarata TaxID=392030 RepID=A0A816UUA1_9BILA|nr:unnamed protein product [Rotaria magnacalcarata]CAF3949810.1 unnamed protein product [Rotaria magnacalcarata]